MVFGQVNPAVFLISGIAALVFFHQMSRLANLVALERPPSGAIVSRPSSGVLERRISDELECWPSGALA